MIVVLEWAKACTIDPHARQVAQRAKETAMRHAYYKERLLSILLIVLLIPLFLRIGLVRWWLILPLTATLLICYLVRIRRLFTILLIMACVLVGLGFFY
jgi:hypothetical protein